MALLDIILSNIQPKSEKLTSISGLSYTGNTLKVIRVNAAEDGFELATISAGISIGDSVGSGTAGSVLYLTTDGELAQSPTRLSYSDTDGLTVSPSGTFASGWQVGLNLKGTDITSRMTSGVYGYGDFLSSGSIFGAYTSNNWTSVTFFSRREGRFKAYGDNFAPQAIVHAKAKVATDIVSIFQGTTAQTGNLTEWRNVSDTVLLGVDKDGNLVCNTSSGNQIGTSASQKIGFFGKTPIVQPTTAIAAATYGSVSGSFVKANDTFGGYTVGQAIQALINLGALE